MPIFAAPPETPLIIDTVIFSHLRNVESYVQKNELSYAQKEVFIYYSNTKALPAISSMTIFEANIGIEEQIASKSITTEEAEFRRRAIDDCVKEYIDRILPFDTKAAEIAAYIYPRLIVNERKELRKRKNRNKKGNKEKYIWQDVFIVSTAVSHSYGLASPDKDIELIAKYLPDDMNLRLAIWKP